MQASPRHTLVQSDARVAAMPKSGPTPIEFNAKLYYISAGLAAVLAVSSVIFGVIAWSVYGILVGVFWAVVSGLAVRAGRNSPE